MPCETGYHQYHNYHLNYNHIHYDIHYNYYDIPYNNYYYHYKNYHKKNYKNHNKNYHHHNNKCCGRDPQGEGEQRGGGAGGGAGAVLPVRLSLLHRGARLFPGNYYLVLTYYSELFTALQFHGGREQQRTCGPDEACLYYAWQKSDNQFCEFSAPVHYRLRQGSITTRFDWIMGRTAIFWPHPILGQTVTVAASGIPGIGPGSNCAPDSRHPGQLFGS